MSYIHVFYDDCSECGSEKSLKCVDDAKRGIVEYDCTECKFSGSDSYIDLYGCMSVPWGGI